MTPKMMIDKMGMKNLLVLLLVAMIAVTIICVSYWIVVIGSAYEVIEMDMDVYVQEKGGFNVDTDAVHFGIVYPGGVSERQIKLTVGPFKSLVTIEARGDIAEWVSASEKNIMLDPGEVKTIKVYASIPEDATVPDFKTGKLLISFKKA